MKNRISKTELINLKLNTYKGTRKAVHSWLEMGRILKFKPSFQEGLKKLKQQVIDAKGSKDKETAVVNALESLLMRVPTRDIPIVHNKLLFYKNKSGSYTGTVSTHGSSQKVTMTNNTINDIIANWIRVENEMVDYDFHTNQLFSKSQHTKYPDWAERFKDAIGLGQTSDAFFDLLFDMSQNKQDIFFLQDWLIKNETTISVDNAVEDMEVAMMDIREKEKQTKDDMRAYDIMDRWRKIL